MKRFLCLLALVLPMLSARAADDTKIYDLRVEGATEPLTLEETRPYFSWKMSSDVFGRTQQSYRIRVLRETDSREVWDSGEVADSVSVGIRYLGLALRSGQGYEWNLEVKDNDGNIHKASSRFEMGLMNPKLSAWKGAQWIGDPSPSLNAASLSLFSISSAFVIVKGGTAGFVFGADDFRLSDVFQNSRKLAGHSYFKVLMDFRRFDTDGCEILVYRVGYAPTDKEDVPLLRINRKTYPKLNLASILGNRGASEDHKLKINVIGGTISFQVDGRDVITDGGKEATRFTISPLGAGYEVNSYPHLCSVGFAAEAGSDVTYTGYTIRVPGRSESVPLFEGAAQLSRFEGLSCVRIPRYRDQSPYEQDVVVINKGAKPVVEYIDPSYGGAKILRTTFGIPDGKKVRKAKLYASALGVYDFYVNGRKVGADWFAPGASRYGERVYYQAYDVTSLLRSGKNAMGAELFEGWYSGFLTYDPADYDFYGDSQALLCRLDLLYEDGSTESVLSIPDKWKSFDGGPVRAGSFFQGERYDANLEQDVKGWSEANYDDSNWKAASVIGLRSGIDPDITARCDGLAQVREVIQAAARSYIHSEDYHTYIYDMGVSITGVPEIIIPAGWLQQGDVVIMRYAALLYPGLDGDSKDDIKRYGRKGLDIAGHMCFETNGSALSTDIYTAAGNEAVTIRPRSTWRPYRYIQITLPSHEGPLPLQNVNGLVLSSCPAPTGNYEAVSEDDNAGETATQLMRSIQRSELSSFFTMPLSYPQSGDRIQWTGDPQTLCGTAIYNADVRNLFREWLRSMRDMLASGGLDDITGSVLCTVPWQIYRQYGDTRIIEENLEAMMDWLGEMSFHPLSVASPHLTAKTGVPEDWLLPDGKRPRDLAGNIIYLNAMDATVRMAHAVGREDYAAMLEQRYALAKAEFERVFPGESLTLPAQGADGESMYASQLGITCGPEAGYKHFVLQPMPDGRFDSLKGGFESPYGYIASRWTTDEHGQLNSYSASVPANTGATLYLPIPGEMEEYGNGEWDRFIGIEEHNGILTAVYELLPGEHEFLIEGESINVL